MEAGACKKLEDDGIRRGPGDRHESGGIQELETSWEASSPRSNRPTERGRCTSAPSRIDLLSPSRHFAQRPWQPASGTHMSPLNTGAMSHSQTYKLSRCGM